MRTGAFPGRTKEKAALASDTHSHGVKRHCAITQRLNHFHVTTGYPPDIMHDLLEGTVPVELALCKETFLARRAQQNHQGFPI